MTLIELQKILGERIAIANDKELSSEERMKETNISQTIASLAKQMINNADMCKDWMPKHRYVYEHAHGKIPDGWIVVFLDRDRRNFSPDNLHAIPRFVHAQMSANGWYTDNKELTLTAIKLCRLNMELKT